MSKRINGYFKEGILFHAYIFSGEHIVSCVVFPWASILWEFTKFYFFLKKEKSKNQPWRGPLFFPHVSEVFFLRKLKPGKFAQYNIISRVLFLLPPLPPPHYYHNVTK
jgi:hypothetical protein